MRRLWPMLINDLSQACDTGKPDVDKIVKHLALGLPMPVRLRKQKNRWARPIHLIVDTSSRLFPFRMDCMHLAAKMRDRIGPHNLRMLRFTNYPGGAWEGWYLDYSPGSDVYTPPPQQGRVLILSDLGVLQEGRAGSGWPEFIRDLHEKNIQVFVFSPAATQRLPVGLQHMAALQPWDTRAVFGRHIGAAKREKLSPVQSDELKELKVILSATSLFTPGLLRRLRTRLLPGSPAALESLIWQDTETFILSGSLGAWQPGRLNAFRAEFRNKKTDWKEKTVEIVADYFQGYPADFLAVQQLIAGSLTNRPADEARQKLQSIVLRVLHAPPGPPDLTCSFLKYFIDSQDETCWQQDQKDLLLHTAFEVVYREELKHGFPYALPKGADPGIIRSRIPARPDRLFSLFQQKTGLVCTFGTNEDQQYHEMNASSLVYTNDGQVLFRKEGKSWKRLRQGRVFSPAQQPLQLDTEKERITLTTLTLPKWADALGRDDWGLFADCRIQGICQRFRWLEPGGFMMGSPENEPGRYDDETLHKVTLSHGFWLADTTVTQELWQAVMGENPSGFKGEKRPVEQVSWQDARLFIEKLNKLVPGLDARLPWEAEWEYACRAGTTTPFSFGDMLTSEQVNFDGNYPYNNGPKSNYRGETVEVKSLPPNPWGLYEMHGNVLEWCQDWRQKDLGSAPVTDPHGPKEGEDRVLRGGSWVNNGGNVRSAIRRRYPPGLRSGSIGFRLARGH